MNQIPEWLAYTQISASIFLGLAALCVGVGSFIISYRNNFGWKPLAFVTSIGMRGRGPAADQTFEAIIQLEIWNRFKYPIRIRNIVVKVENLDLQLPVSYPEKPKWVVGYNSVSLHEPYTLAPSSHETHDIAVPFKAPSLDAVRAPMTIVVHWFDPRRNANGTIKINDEYRLSTTSPSRAISTPDATA